MFGSQGQARLAIGVSDFSTSEPLLNAEKIISCGMNFIEPGLAKIAAMPSADFAVAAERIQNNGIRVQSVNWLLPPQLKVTGPEVDEVITRHFLESALARAEKLGAKAVVFGSPGSRSLPDAFPMKKGREQLIAFCQLCSDVIRQHQWGMMISKQTATVLSKAFQR